MIIDAFGKPCPMPVILAKKELDRGEKDITVAVDNEIAVQNLSRLAAACGMTVISEETAGGFHVRIFGEGEISAKEETPKTAPWVLFVGRDGIGGGSDELGYNLLRMELYTLSQGDTVPEAILFMNAGVKLPAGDDTQVTDSLKMLASRGTELLVCGTCLNYYGLTESLKVGAVSNMYDMLVRIQRAEKCVTL